MINNPVREYLKLINMVHSYIDIEKQLLNEYPLVNGLNDYRKCKQQNKQTTTSNINTEECQNKMEKIKNKALVCQRCGLSKTRTQVVFGEGSLNSKLVIVGEAPGFYEDQKGLPFVGEAGQLLTKMLQAIGLKRKDVYICNVIKCRPPKNRNPEPNEIAACSQWLEFQLKIMQPEIICAMGRFASCVLTGIDQEMWKYRNNIYNYQGIVLICTYHPAYLLRSPEQKRKSWQDLLKIQTFLKKNR